ncbi:acylphosphatase-2-like protein [Cricetulus griseus]|uniref:Acylphosphatase n=1 Tax=Cricetulus griseus TaxID=10029 RepID=A0A061ILS5_CRIGR|nr:acylphosphatase-2-like protein [Cricetulus griseus]
MSLLRAAAAAAPAPHTRLPLLVRRLATMAERLKSVDYEVFGRVQGVSFRMYTEEEAKKTGVVGWVKNTSKGTVTGQVQGPEAKVDSIYGVVILVINGKRFQGAEGGEHSPLTHTTA